jgi:hypothetical protein
VNIHQTDSKTSVLIFVGMVLVFSFVRIIARRLVGPAWADPFAQTALLAYFNFLFARRVNWIRTAIGWAFALAFLLVVNYVRVHEQPAINDGLVLGIGAVVVGLTWWGAARKKLQPGA